MQQSGQTQQAEQAARQLLKEHPQDKDVQAMAALMQRHTMGINASSLAKRIAGLFSSRQAQSAPSGSAADSPRLAAVGLPPSPAVIAAARVPEALRASLSEATLLKMQLKDYSGAESDLTETIRRDPGNWLAYRLRALTRRFMGKSAEAEADADQALSLNPRDGASHGVKALLRLDARDPSGALKEADLAVSLDPRSADAHATRAQALQELGRPKEALAELKLAADLDAGFAAAYRQALYGLGAPPSLRLSQTRALYLGAVGLALLFLGLALVFGRSPATTALRAPMRAQDRKSSGVSGFRLLRRLGQGGMGVVYEAFDEKLQRKVALKRMRSEIAGEPRERSRFIKEARLVAGLRHPGIVEIYSIVEDGDDLYLVFEYLPGQTLDLLLRQAGRLSPKEAVPVLRQVADALDYAHSQGVVHQDLKPGNVIVGSGRAKVMDFGIARRVQETLSTLSRREIIGTPAYMAPEQQRGVVTPKADIFALGVCAYELLSGSPPFPREGGSFAALDAYPPLSRAAGLPQAVDAVIARALSAQPEARQARAALLAAELGGAIGLYPS